MATLEKKFSKYTVTLDTDMGDGATGCWIQYKGFSASLEMADDMGVLINDNENEHEMEQAVIDDIRKWADENGY